MGSGDGARSEDGSAVRSSLPGELQGAVGFAALEAEVEALPDTAASHGSGAECGSPPGWSCAVGAVQGARCSAAGLGCPPGRWPCPGEELFL